MGTLCWNCASIAKCPVASGKISRCSRFNPYLSVEEFCIELGIKHWQFKERTQNESSFKGLQKDARAKGIVIIKDYSPNKLKITWVIYKVKIWSDLLWDFSSVP